MAERLRAATANLKRELQSLKHLNKTDPAVHSETSSLQQLTAEALQAHEDFTIWYLNFLSDELVCTASYQRHITSLRAIQLLLRSGVVFPIENSAITVSEASQLRQPSSTSGLFTSSLIRLLLDSVADPFEDVRVAATEILKLAPREVFENDRGVIIDDGNRNKLSLVILRNFGARLKLAAEVSGRADQADGVSRCHELLYYFAQTNSERIHVVLQMVEDLESKTQEAKNDFCAAVESHPIHGQFASIKLVRTTPF